MQKVISTTSGTHYMRKTHDNKVSFEKCRCFHYSSIKCTKRKFQHHLLHFVYTSYTLNLNILSKNLFIFSFVNKDIFYNINNYFIYQDNNPYSSLFDKVLIHKKNITPINIACLYFSIQKHSSFSNLESYNN